MRVVLDVVDLDDLELLAEAAVAEANRLRVAAEGASAEVARDRASGQDIRTRAVRIVGVLGSAGRLIEVARAVRDAKPLSDLSASWSPADVAAPGGPLTPPDAVPAPTDGEDAADVLAAQVAAFGGAADPEPVDADAAATLANLQRAGAAALGPDADPTHAAVDDSAGVAAAGGGR